MIRASDLANTAAWVARPAGQTSRAEVRDASNWFDEAALAPMQISGDVGVASRGLSVDQHAARVLAQLLGEPDSL
jgi:hypothetical protein